MNTGKDKDTKKNPQKFEALIFDKTATGTFKDFNTLAERMGMKYILYVQDVAGEQNSVWVCQEWQFSDCIEEICNKGYFINVQKIGQDMFLATVHLLGNTPIAS